MRELDKKEKNVRFIVFLVLVGAVFFTVGSTIVYITGIRCISVCGTGVTK